MYSPSLILNSNGCPGNSTASSEAKVSMTTDSPMTYDLCQANSKEASIVQGEHDDDVDMDKEEDDKE
jgi:hypothetical protein